jgi:hypothetical protein
MPATHTPAQVYALARAAGLNAAQSVTATAIAMAESGLNADAVGDEGLVDSKWGPSVGLWQIRSVKAETGKGTSRDVTRLRDPAFNARSMVEISGRGANWRPWSVYLHGTYAKFLPQVPGAAAESAVAAGAADTGPGQTEVWKASMDGEGLLDQLNPFDDWETTALRLVLTLAAVALVVVGATQAVGKD